jgi:hypothetical protein
MVWQSKFNHTIVKMARAMLFSSNLPCSFWAKAITTAMHIHNHSPTHANNNQSLHEVLHGDPPTLSHFHPFGMRTHLLLPKHKCDKLDLHGIKAHYLGPTHNQSMHQMWIPSLCSTTMSCNIMFIIECPTVSSPTALLDSTATTIPSLPATSTDDQLEPGVDETVDTLLLGEQDTTLHHV